MKMWLKIAVFIMFSYNLAHSADKKFICDKEELNYDYCKTLKKYHYQKKKDLEHILYMTDNLEYLKRDRTSQRDKEHRRFIRSIQKKLYEVMFDINGLIKIVTNEVRKQKYRAMGMVVLPLKFGSHQKLKYRDFNEMTRGGLKREIEVFFNTYEKFGDEFLTDVLTANNSAFMVFPQIVQYDEFKIDMHNKKEAELQIAISGFFGLEKGMSESVVVLGLKTSKDGKLRRVASRKEEYEKLKKALVELMDKALADIASQEE